MVLAVNDFTVCDPKKEVTQAMQRHRSQDQFHSVLYACANLILISRIESGHETNT